MAGSKKEVKNDEVAMQATPMETLEAWMLAKNATQWIPRRTPQPAIIIAARHPGNKTDCCVLELPGREAVRMRMSTAARETSAIIERYQTRGRPPKEMILPNIPVHPARKTATCSRIRVPVLLL